MNYAHGMSVETESLNPSRSVDSTFDSFNIVLLYQDQESALRGLQTCEKISAGLGKTFEINKVMWKFDLLNLPKMRELARDDAAGADMFIFAMREDTELPQAVCTWIEDGLTEASEKPRALVALLSREIGALASSGLDYLRRFAEARKLDFFTNLERDEAQGWSALPA